MQSGAQDPLLSSTATIMSASSLCLPDEVPLLNKTFSQSSEDEIVVTQTPLRPLENKPLSHFTSQQLLPHETYHVIKKVEFIEGDELRIFYLKMKSSLSELEAALAAHYKLLAPLHVPATYAVYDEKHYIGVASEEIYRFRQLSKNPWTVEDFDVTFIKRENISYQDLDVWDDKLRELEINAEQLARRKQLLNAKKNAAADEAEAKLAESFTKFFEDLTATLKINKQEFKRFRDLKGMAIGLTASHIFEEDDCHQNNISKDGKRVDFDMSMWPLVYKINDKGIIASIRRMPVALARAVAKEDIINFPDISVVQPFFWPTRETPLFSDETHDFLNRIITLPNNRYTSAAVSINKCLSKNPVVIHYKYQTMLKYILSNASMYEKLALLHMPEETQYQSKLLYKVLAGEHNQRIIDFERALGNIPEFIDFFFQHGEHVLQEFLSDLAKHNDLYQTRAVAPNAKLEALQKQCENAALTNFKSVMDALNKEILETKALIKMLNFQVIKTDEVVLAFNEIKSTFAITREKNLAKPVDADSDYFVVGAKSECEESKEQELHYLHVKKTITDTFRIHSTSTLTNFFNLLTSTSPPADPNAQELLEFCGVVAGTDKLAPLEKIKVLEDKLVSIKADGEQKESNVSQSFLIKVTNLLANAPLWQCGVEVAPVGGLRAV